MGRIRITQTRSAIGHAAVMRRTLAALGLRGYQRWVEHEETPQIRGMIRRVHHLVAVTPAAAGEAEGGARPRPSRGGAGAGAAEEERT
jgi:large subunit ribosomal protein L30